MRVSNGEAYAMVLILSLSKDEDHHARRWPPYIRFRSGTRSG